MSANLKDVEQAQGDIMAEALRRLRSKDVIRHAGYDGEYGVIKLFEEGELGAKRTRLSHAA